MSGVGRRLRLLHVLAAPYPTLQGSQVYVGGLVRGLAARGHEVTLLCYAHAAGRTRGSRDGLRIVRTPSIPGYSRLRAGPDLVKPAIDVALAARACALSRHVDLVHVHNYEAPIAGYLARALHGVPVVYHGHNTMQDELPTYFGLGVKRRLAHHVGGLLDRTIPHRADLALAISESGLAALRGLGCRDVRLLRPAVDLEDLDGAHREEARRQHGLRGRRWVVYAGNFDTYQDLDLLLAAVARLPAAGLLLATAGPIAALGRRCDLFGIGPARRRLIRVASWSESRDLIAAGDVAALPRTVCSGFPIKLLCYLGLGVPAVVSAASAAPIDGLVAVHDRDPGGMAAAVGYLLDHEEQRVGLGDLGRAAIRDDWSWKQRIPELEAIYAELLGRR